MAEKKPKEVEYFDPEGKRQKGWYLGGHVYTDEAATTPISVGSTFRAGNGTYYRMTPYGGVRWSVPNQENAAGEWVPQGNAWYRSAQDLTQTLAQRPAFSYDPETDPLYRGARNQAIREGQRAMADTLGRASGLTGGFGSTYAQLAGQQAYQSRLTELSDLLPELYDRAKKTYDSRTQDLLDALGAATGLYDREYQTWLDRQDARRKQAEFDRAGDQWERAFSRDSDQWQQEFDEDQQRWLLDFDRDNDHWERDFAWDRDRWQQEFDEDQQRWLLDFDRDNDHWEREFDRDNDHWERDFDRDNDHWERDFDRDNDQWEREFAERLREWEEDFARDEAHWAEQQADDDASRADSAAARERSYAYRMAILALQHGLEVSDNLLAAAGIDRDYAERLRRYFAGE